MKFKSDVASCDMSSLLQPTLPTGTDC